MAQGLRALDAVAEDLVSILSTHMMANNHLQLQFQAIQCPFLTPTSIERHKCTFIHAGNPLTHIKYKIEEAFNS